MLATSGNGHTVAPVKNPVTRPLRIVAAAVLVTVFAVGIVAIALDRLRDDKSLPPARIDESTLSEPVSTGSGCDWIPDVDECPPYELIEEPTLAGAAERLRNGQLYPSDVLYLMYTEKDYTAALEPYLGPAVAQPAYVPSFDGPWGRSMEGIDRGESYQLMRPWDLAGGSVLFEFVFVLPSTADVATFLENHRVLLNEVGVRPAELPGLGDGIDAPVLYRFIDSQAPTPVRRCVNRVLHAYDRIVFAVTLATGGDCSTPPVELPVGIILGASSRARTLFGDALPLP